MEGTPLYEFYSKALMPQFGFINADITWIGSVTLRPDEVAHYFTIGIIEYVLIFEDYDGLGRNEQFIKDAVIKPGQKHEFIVPVSHQQFPLYPTSPSRTLRTSFCQ